MSLLFIRHADPDYARDSLTPRGEEEALALAETLREQRIDAVFCSPLGRAKRTMEVGLSLRGDQLPVKILPWLREFDAVTPHPPQQRAWDFLPEDIARYGEDAYSLKDYADAVIPYRDSMDFIAKRDEAFAGLDALLAENGYQKDGLLYRVTASNDRTLVFFCHFGIEALLLSRLVNAPPLVFFQGTCASPSSITEVYTEERREGIASFRILHFGETAHLRKKDMEDSFAARFSETFDDPRRHD